MKNVKMIIAVVATMLAGFANAGGYDASVYQQAPQAGGQIMTQGQARTMRVLAARAVKMEVQGNGSNTQTYMYTAAGTAVGGVLGNQVGRPGSGERQLGAVLGGVLGALGGSMLAEATSGPKTVEGQELTLLDPMTKQVIVIVQGGNERFAEGQDVLAIQMGSTTRITAAPRQLAYAR